MYPARGERQAQLWTGLCMSVLTVLLMAGCAGGEGGGQDEGNPSSEEQFNTFFDANYAGLTVKDLQSGGFTPEGGCVTKGSITLADTKQQEELQQMTGDMGVHWEDGTTKDDISVEAITPGTEPDSPVVGIEETVEAKDWNEEHPGETPSDFGQEFLLFENMGEMDMEPMEENGDEGEYALHGYRNNNANGTFAPVDSNIQCPQR